MTHQSYAHGVAHASMALLDINMGACNHNGLDRETRVRSCRWPSACSGSRLGSMCLAANALVKLRTNGPRGLSVKEAVVSRRLSDGSGREGIRVVAGCS